VAWLRRAALLEGGAADRADRAGAEPGQGKRSATDEGREGRSIQLAEAVNHCGDGCRGLAVACCEGRLQGAVLCPT